MCWGKPGLVMIFFASPEEHACKEAYGEVQALESRELSACLDV